MTRIIAHFDHAGKIRSLISVENAPPGVSISLAPAPGEQIAELDARAIGVTTSDANKLRAIARAHTISDPVLHRTLIKIP